MTLKDNGIIINGHQLREAMEFLAPDNTDEQLGQEVVISLGGAEFHSGPGLYCWAHEYPEEGAIKLDSEPSPPGYPTPATPSQREREAFEAWMRTFDMPPQLEGEVFLDEQLIEADCYGQFVYEDHSTQRCWAAWQARATLLTLPAAFAQPIRSAFLDGYRQGIHDQLVDEEAAWNRSRSIHVAHDAEQHGAPPAVGVPDECPHMIVFDDADVAPVMFAGAGARQAAIAKWGQISNNWNAHLFVRIEKNCRDDRYPCAQVAPTPSASEQQQAVSDEDAVQILLSGGTLTFGPSPDERTVTIPGCDQHEGSNSLRLTLPWACLHCGGPRGEPYESASYDGSRRLSVHRWDNPCGHVETYSEVRAALDKTEAGNGGDA